MSEPAGPPTFDDYSFPGYAYPGEPRKPVTYQIPAHMNRRLNGAARWAGDTGKLPGIVTKVDLIRVALHIFLTELEQRYLGGHPFPPPQVTARGRGTGRDAVWEKVTVHLPVSLTQRAAGAVEFITDTALLPDVTSVNRLVAHAVDIYLRNIEASHRQGRPFKDPRRLSPGRPPRK